MRLFDVSGCEAYIIRPGTTLTKWAQENNPYAVCNASLYDMTTRIPIGTIVENKEYVHNDGNGFGFGVISHQPSFGGPWEKFWDDYLTGYPSPVQNGKYVPPAFTNAIFNTRTARIGIGEKSGNIVIVTDDNVTLKEFADHAISMGLKTLVNLDGGGSRHVWYNNKTVYSSSRVPYNAIAFFKPGMQPKKGYLEYADISAWQTNVDYKKASKQLDGVILRAGYGKGVQDSMFETHYASFMKYNVPIGVYWFSYAKTVEEATAEAESLLKVIKGKKISLPVCFDFEDDSIKNAKLAGVSMTKDLVTKMATAFLSVIEKNKYYAMLYANPNFLQNFYGNVSRFDLWLAQYPTKPNPAIPPRSCGIWQYGTMKHDGFSGEIDMNASYKDYAKIIRDAKLNHLAEYVENPEPVVTKPDPEPIVTPGITGIEWATKNGLLLKDEVDVKATKGDIAQMLYEYHMIFTPEDGKSVSGLLGG